jgi:2OG-Fe(II) oxygenase superfamily
VSRLPLDQIVDLGRYPIHELDGPDGQALVAHARTALHAVGACDLPGFLRPEAISAAVDSALSVRAKAYRTEQTHDIEFSGLAAESLTADDPRRTRIRSGKEGTALDDIPADSPVRTVYESDELTAFVGAALEIDPIYRSEDPLGALNYMYYAPGDELGWHFDGADFVVTLLLQGSEAGGTFEFAPMLRSADDRNDEGVRTLLAGTSERVQTMSGEPGTLALFRGHWSPHRVTPVEGSRTRINAVLSYAVAPGHRLGEETYRLFYGRTPGS